MKNKKIYVVFISIIFLYFSYLLQENYLIYNAKDNKKILFGRVDKDYGNIEPILANNHPLEYVWNRTWGGDKEDNIKEIAVDSSDNIYIAGTTESFGAGGEDIYLIKYDKSGNKKWDVTWGGYRNDCCCKVILDTSENIYLAGTTGSFSKCGDDMCLVKYDSSGVQQWNRTSGGSVGDYCYGIALDSSDNIYLAGSIHSFIMNMTSMYLVKYDKSGNYKWNRTWGENYFNSAYALVLDSSNNIYIAGSTYSYGARESDLFLVKYNSLGTQLWNHTWGGSEHEYCSRVVLDSSNNVYIAGSTYSYGAGNSDLFLVKYNSLGTFLWNVSWGRSQWDYSYDLALDSSNNILLLGAMDVDLGNDINLDMCLVKYNSLGTQLWNRTWGGSEKDIGRALAIDSSNNIYIAGDTYDFGTRQSDFYLVKYDSSGVQQWNRIWSGNDFKFVEAVALDSSDNVLVTGRSSSFGANEYDMCLVKYSLEPQIMINSPIHNEFFRNNAPNFDISISVVEGNLNTIWYSLDNGMTNNTLSELIGTIDQTEWNKKGDGSVTIQLYANDTMGNEGYAEMIVRKDITAPISSISFIPHSGNNTVNISTLFTLTSDDGIGFGISRINYKINDSYWIRYNEPFNLSGYEFGDYKISYSAIDIVGNIEEINTLLVKIVDIGIIAGYDLVLLFSVIGLISVILIKKRLKF